MQGVRDRTANCNQQSALEGLTAAFASAKPKISSMGCRACPIFSRIGFVARLDAVDYLEGALCQRQLREGRRWRAAHELAPVGHQHLPQQLPPIRGVSVVTSGHAAERFVHDMPLWE